jgi:hypothetical protein
MVGDGWPTGVLPIANIAVDSYRQPCVKRLGWKTFFVSFLKEEIAVRTYGNITSAN